MPAPVTDDDDRKVYRKWVLQDYRAKHRERLNQKAKERAAKSRASLKDLPVQVQEAKRLAKLEYARRYREKNRSYLKAQARDRRAAKYIDEHGYEAYCTSYRGQKPLEDSVDASL
ncbi:hypothetical protein FPV67DRAFT_1676137 [Lyophyllum atratum]|nr:hypothetical protein FPV67DRAFT_1676137 [Lyophyllum atratum]